MEKLKGPRPPSDDPPELPPTPIEGVRATVNRCPYCHEDVLADATDTLACAGCLARHHEACWRESSRCGSCSGEAALTRGAPAASPKARSRRAAAIATIAALWLLAGAFTALLVVGSSQTSRVETGPAPAVDVAPAVGLGADLSEERGRGGVVLGKVFVGSAAHAAGLRQGDLVQSVDGAPVDGLSSLWRALAGRAAGDTVRLGVRPSLGGEAHLQLELIAPTPSGESDPINRQRLLEHLGLAVLAGPDGAGVLVDDVSVGGPLDGQGLRQGDVIESVDGRPVRSVGDLDRLVGEGRGPFRLGVRPAYGAPRIILVPVF